MDVAIDLPAIDDEPSYLETGLWERNLRRSEITAARNLNSTLRIAAGTARFADPVTGIERVFALRDELRDLLRGLASNPDAVGTVPLNLRERLVALGILQDRGQGLRRRRARQAALGKARQAFARCGYVKLPRLLSPIHLAWLRRRYRRLVREATLKYGDGQCPTRWIAHNEPAARIFHPSLTALVSDVARTQVKPSYLYLGCYDSGSVLPEHVDREQCEFSITLLVDYVPEPTGDSPWPLYLRTAKKVVAIRQRVGDALLYRGRTLPHFRKALPEGHTSTSLFFHFVPPNFAGSMD